MLQVPFGKLEEYLSLFKAWPAAQTSTLALVGQLCVVHFFQSKGFSLTETAMVFSLVHVWHVEEG